MSGPAAPTQRQWLAIALVVFVLASAQLFSGLLGADPRRVVPANIAGPPGESQGSGDWESLGETDLRFVVWLIARNAWTLTHAPGSLFDAEPCAPAENALAFGEPGIGLGFLAAPLSLLLGDPVATFNATLLVMTLLSALALFLLIREWTASAPAGIAAGVLYAFHVLKIGDVVHVIIWDTAWTAFALYFATRVFRTGSNAAAIGLAASIGMQVAGSLYPLMAAVLIGLPLGAWLFLRYGVERAGLPRLLAVIAAVGLLAMLVFAPYLRQSEEGAIQEAAYQVYRPLSYLLPGGSGFSGWVLLGLAALGLGLALRRDDEAGASPAVDPGPEAAPDAPGSAAAASGAPLLRAGSSARWVLFLAGALIFALAVVGEGEPGQSTQAVLRGQPAPDGFPNLYLALSALLPGLDAVRGPGAMYGGVHLVLCILAGLGAAALLERTPVRGRVALAALLIALAFVDTLRPAFLGFTPRTDYTLFEIRPDEETLALFAELEAMGDAGPLLEYPVNHLNFWKASKGVLLSAYHHRRTSHCYNSFFPPESTAVEEESRQLPAIAPLARLYDMGFRTLLVHHGAGEVAGPERQRTFERFVAGAGRAHLEELARTPSLTAYRIVR